VLYRTKYLRPRRKGDPTVTDRQERLKKHNQAALARSTILLIGAGGLGSEYGTALVRKGVGRLILFDHDVVELSNLNRQKFYKADLYKPKAHCLARNLAKEGFCGGVIEGYSLCFEDALKQGIDLSCTLAIVGIDNNVGRVAASSYFRQQQIPCIFTAVSTEASNGFVFVQEPGMACFGCLFKDAIDDETHYPCSPSITNIRKVMGGIVSYAVDSLLMERLRTWSYMEIFLDGSVPHLTWTVARRPDCKLCGLSTTETQAGSRVNHAMQTEGSV
jgi:molybdopterin/thiamine biosynthesis adenylyltransferase